MGDGLSRDRTRQYSISAMNVKKKQVRSQWSMAFRYEVLYSERVKVMRLSCRILIDSYLGVSLNTELIVDMSVRVVVTARVILPGTRWYGIHRDTRLT